MTRDNDDSTRLDDGLLYSVRFDDFYSSRENPAQEKHHVFCEGNRLPQRFSHAERFVIGELGFGSGTGFLATAALWQATAPPGARLAFVSVERYPLPRELLRRYLTRFPQWHDLTERLLAQWPGAMAGFHRLNFDDIGIELTLIVDEAAAGLRRLDASIDAWYLDGFAPARNPQMWRPAVLREVARLSHAGTTLATYTAAGQVRRDLTRVGFIVEKAPGYGRKRERLVGRCRIQRSRGTSRLPRHLQGAVVEPPPARIVVIGAGLAGCACANRLAARGHRVTLLERGDAIASGTSSNPAAIMQPFLSRDGNVASRFSHQGYRYTLQRVAAMTRRGIDSGFHGGGLLSVVKSDDDRHRKRAAANDPGFPDDHLRWVTTASLEGMPPDIDADGLLYPGGGWFDVARFCRALVEEQPSLIRLQTGTPVEALSRRQGQWRITTPEGVIETPVVVLATGHWITEMPQAAELPLIANHGQLEHAPCRSMPPLPIAHKGYLIPADDGLFFGSTYETGTGTGTRTAAANTELNLTALGRLSPALAAAVDRNAVSPWQGIRLTTPDHLPLVGELPRAAAWCERFAPYLRGRAPADVADPAWHIGLYCLGALGSRALTSALLGAEIVAARIDGTPPPVERAVAEALHPARFLARRLTR